MSGRPSFKLPSLRTHRETSWDCSCAAVAQAIEAFPQKRLAENVPLTGSEATLRRVLDELRASPDYDRMTPILAQAVRDALPSIQAELGSLGSALSVEFLGVGSRGEDVYSVHFSNGDAEWRIRLTSEGVLEWLQHYPFKEASRLPLANVSALRPQPGGELTTLEFINRTNAGPGRAAPCRGIQGDSWLERRRGELVRPSRPIALPPCGACALRADRYATPQPEPAG
jgi:hypothetical protein